MLNAAKTITSFLNKLNVRAPTDTKNAGMQVKELLKI